MLQEKWFCLEPGATRRWRYGWFVMVGLAVFALATLTLSAGPARGDSGTTASQRAASGTIASEQAVATALNWLARHQAADGRWSFQYQAACKDATCTGAVATKADPAATALTLLAFLGVGQMHQTKGPYREKLARGLDWLTQQQAVDGNLSGSGVSGGKMYAHGMAALVLCQAYRLSGDKKLASPAQKAIDYIEAAQNQQTGGWRYNPGDLGDTSVLGWQILALQSGKMAGLAVKPATFTGAQKYLKTVAQGEHGGKFSYVPGSAPSPTMTAVGVLASRCLGAEPTDPAVMEGVGFLKKSLPDGQQRRDSYHWFFATQVMYNMGGPDWHAWNRQLRRTLMDTQVKEGCAAGSWDPNKPSRDIWGQQGGRLAVTALSTLALETYYRYLPIHKARQGEAKPATKAEK